MQVSREGNLLGCRGVASNDLVDNKLHLSAGEHCIRMCFLLLCTYFKIVLLRARACCGLQSYFFFSLQDVVVLQWLNLCGEIKKDCRCWIGSGMLDYHFCSFV